MPRPPAALPPPRAWRCRCAVRSDGSSRPVLGQTLGGLNAAAQVEAGVEAHAEPRESGALGALGVAADLGDSALCGQLCGQW